MSSREYKNERIVLWPAYIDSTKSRGKGRKISREDCVPKPRVEEIVEAAEILGLDPIVEEKNYPRLWWEQDKRIVVLKKYSRQELYRRIAKKIKEIREARKRAIK